MDYGFSGIPNSDVAEKAFSFGANVNRIYVDWAQVGSSYDWGWIDAQVSWEKAGYLLCPSGNTDWAKSISALVTRYPNAYGVEIVNEPNGTALSAEQYADILTTSYHAANGRLKICSGGLSGGGLPYLTRMYQHGFSCDVLGLHPYPSLGGNSNLAIDMANTVASYRKIRDSFGDSKHFWITEVGVSTKGNGSYPQVTEIDQGPVLADMYQRLKAMSDVDLVTFFTLIEPVSNNPWDIGLGIYHPDGSPKPAARALRKAMLPNWGTAMGHHGRRVL